MLDVLEAFSNVFIIDIKKLVTLMQITGATGSTGPTGATGPTGSIGIRD